MALHLAGSYLERYRYDQQGRPGAYLAEFRRADLLAHSSLVGGEHSPTGHELHAANTFAPSGRRLDAADLTDRTARELLFRAACCAPGEPIPRELGGRCGLGALLSQRAANQDACVSAI